MSPTQVYEEDVWRVLATIPDPEFGLTITEMGLIYGVECRDGDVKVAMTLTTPSCPASGVIVDGVRAAVGRMPGVCSVQVDLVWDPVWNSSMLSPAAKSHLGWRDQD